jgi:hypothetical protein
LLDAWNIASDSRDVCEDMSLSPTPTLSNTSTAKAGNNSDAKAVNVPDGGKSNRNNRLIEPGREDPDVGSTDS